MTEVKHYKELSKGLAAVMNDVLESWAMGLQPHEDEEVYSQAEHMLKVYKRFIEENESNE